MVLMPKKLVAVSAACSAWLAASSAGVGMAANAESKATAAQWWPLAASIDVVALASNQAR